jgi:hypothetical protein
LLPDGTACASVHFVDHGPTVIATACHHDGKIVAAF